MAVDRTMSDARSLLIALKSLDSNMKTSLQSLESKKPDGVTIAGKLADHKITSSSDASKPDIIRRNDRVIVTVSIMFMKIGNIDTIHDRYQADVNVVLKWREPLLDGKKLKSEDVEWSHYWNPKISLANGIGEHKTKVVQSVKYDVNGRANVRELRQMSGLFFEFMELYQFPFDSQDLTVTLVSDRDASELQLTEDPDEKCSINAKAFTSEQEWKLMREVNVWKKTVIKKANKMTKKHPGFNTAAKASRRPQFFIWNIIVIMSIICSMAFATFTVALTIPQSRLQLTFILLLTTVTFKFAVNKNLPKISYLTLMDKYILSSMAILFLVCVWHALIGGVIHPNTKPRAVSNSSSTTPVSVSTTPLSAPVSLTTVAMTTVCPTSSSSTTDSVSSGTVMADYIALGVLLFLYILLHVALVILTVCNSDDDMTLNIELDDEDQARRDEDGKSIPEVGLNSEKAMMSFPPGYNSAAYYGNNQQQQPKHNGTHQHR